MPLLALAFVLLLPFLLVLLLPISLVQRYRVGTARRPARGWVATLNLAGVLVSAALFLVGAAITATWVPNTFRSSLLGMATGTLVGLIGLATSRWEETPHALYFRPNRALVLLIVVVVMGRLLYGFWRMWHAWHAPGDESSWLARGGLAGSLGAGAFVLGYYATYWAGVRARLASYRQDRTGPGRI